jgi:hypothetical protein
MVGTSNESVPVAWPRQDPRRHPRGGKHIVTPQKKDAENDELGGYHVFSLSFPCRNLVKMQKHSKS